MGRLVKWWEEAIGLVGLGLGDIVDWPDAGLKRTVGGMLLGRFRGLGR